MQLNEFIENNVSEKEEMIVEFFNNAEAINTRLHQFELLPGFGKKHTESILDERNKKMFETLEDLKKRVSNLPDPRKAVEKRLLDEIMGKEKYYLFMGK
jgi:putative nucleotide binding protein